MYPGYPFGAAPMNPEQAWQEFTAPDGEDKSSLTHHF